MTYHRRSWGPYRSWFNLKTTLRIVFYSFCFFLIFLVAGKFLVVRDYGAVTDLQLFYRNNKMILKWTPVNSKRVVGYDIFYMENNRLKSIGYTKASEFDVSKAKLKVKGFICVQPNFRGILKARGEIQSIVFDPVAVVYHFSAEMGVFNGVKLQKPMGLAGDLGGGLYIVDADNERVLRYTGKQESTEEIAAKYPTGVLVSSQGDVFVLEGLSGIIKKYHDRRLVKQIKYQAQDSGMMYFISTWCIDRNDQLYVVDWNNNTISIYSSELNPIKTYHLGKQLLSLTSIAVDSNKIMFLVDTIGQSVFRYDGHQMKKVDFENTVLPVVIHIDSRNNFYVADKNDFLIKKYSSAYQVLAKVGGFGNGPGQLIRPSAIYVDDLGDLFVNDVERNVVIRYSGSFH